MKNLILMLSLCIVMALTVAGCGQIDQAGVALAPPALSPAPPTATPVPITPTAPPVAYPLDTPILTASTAITAENIAQITELAALSGSIGPLTRLAFDPQRTRLAASDYEGGALVWNIPASTLQTMPYISGEATPNPLGEWAGSPGRIPYGALQFLPELDELMVVGPENVRTWQLTDNTLVVDAPLSDGGNFDANGSVTLNKAGNMLARGGMKGGFNNYREGMARIWDMSEERRVLNLEGHSGWVQALAFSPDSTQLATVGTDHRLMLWNTEDATLMQDINAITRRPNDLLFSPDGSQIACGDSDGTIRLWDTETGDLMTEILTDLPIARLAFDPTGHLIAAALFNHTVHVWDAANGTLLHTLSIPPQTDTTTQSEYVPIPSVAFSPDGMLLATLDRENVVHLWGLP